MQRRELSQDLAVPLASYFVSQNAEPERSAPRWQRGNAGHDGDEAREQPAPAGHFLAPSSRAKAGAEAGAGGAGRAGGVSSSWQSGLDGRYRREGAGGGDKELLLDRECSSPTRVHLRRTGDPRKNNNNGAAR